ncbi:MAG: hypothetical protein A2527_10925 [Candidatus Lambdaproteobacteria bacterium RIFOXYD2_FULL_50_16]|uniref:YcxB-like C-terminal domain-containing protein n=1 Tax=Candidatus Lambdaproteobacteria bacterium RIFOXYD2_FULL_50_16 TaxID=1817772 RepID=A0A1F6G6A9_9PROT|nr:MAG: hypothetical protein A2527_10925 [Candidatus Lambdaproteobacteria bacterium RIFOXYD2_FULL_50_16]
MKLTVELSPKDLQRMLRHIQLGQNRTIDMVYWVFSLFSLCMISVVVFVENMSNWSIVAFMFPPILYFGVFPLMLMKQAIALYQEKDVFQRPITYEFKEEGIFTENARGAELILWGRFARVVETAHDFVFYLEKTKAFTIPRRYVPTEQERRQLQSVIVNYYNPNKFFRYA